jgi:hypothetical protein
MPPPEGRDFLEYEQKCASQSGRIAKRPDGKIDGRPAAIGLKLHAVLGNGSLLFHGFADGNVKLFAQPLASHGKDIQVGLA